MSDAVWQGASSTASGWNASHALPRAQPNSPGPSHGTRVVLSPIIARGNPSQPPSPRRVKKRRPSKKKKRSRNNYDSTVGRSDDSPGLERWKGPKGMPDVFVAYPPAKPHTNGPAPGQRGGKGPKRNPIPATNDTAAAPRSPNWEVRGRSRTPSPAAREVAADQRSPNRKGRSPPRSVLPRRDDSRDRSEGGARSIHWVAYERSGRTVAEAKGEQRDRGGLKSKDHMTTRDSSGVTKAGAVQLEKAADTHANLPGIPEEFVLIWKYLSQFPHRKHDKEAFSRVVKDYAVKAYEDRTVPGIRRICIEDVRNLCFSLLKATAASDKFPNQRVQRLFTERIDEPVTLRRNLHPKQRGERVQIDYKVPPVLMDTYLYLDFKDAPHRVELRRIVLELMMMQFRDEHGYEPQCAADDFEELFDKQARKAYQDTVSTRVRNRRGRLKGRRRESPCANCAEKMRRTAPRTATGLEEELVHIYELVREKKDNALMAAFRRVAAASLLRQLGEDPLTMTGPRVSEATLEDMVTRYLKKAVEESNASGLSWREKLARSTIMDKIPQSLMELYYYMACNFLPYGHFLRSFTVDLMKEAYIAKNGYEPGDSRIDGFSSLFATQLTQLKELKEAEAKEMERSCTCPRGPRSGKSLSPPSGSRSASPGNSSPGSWSRSSPATSPMRQSSRSSSPSGFSLRSPSPKTSQQQAKRQVRMEVPGEFDSLHRLLPDEYDDGDEAFLRSRRRAKDEADSAAMRRVEKELARSGVPVHQSCDTPKNNMKARGAPMQEVALVWYDELSEKCASFIDPELRLSSRPAEIRWDCILLYKAVLSRLKSWEVATRGDIEVGDILQYHSEKIQPTFLRSILSYIEESIPDDALEVLLFAPLRDIDTSQLWELKKTLVKIHDCAEDMHKSTAVYLRREAKINYTVSMSEPLIEDLIRSATIDLPNIPVLDQPKGETLTGLPCAELWMKMAVEFIDDPKDLRVHEYANEKDMPKFMANTSRLFTAAFLALKAYATLKGHGPISARELIFRESPPQQPPQSAGATTAAATRDDEIYVLAEKLNGCCTAARNEARAWISMGVVDFYSMLRCQSQVYRDIQAISRQIVSAVQKQISSHR